MYERGYVVSSDGNVSVRLDDGRILATPTMTCKGRMTEDLLAITDLDTLFLDVTLLAIAIAIFRLHGVTRYNVASLVLVVTLAAISAVVVAYAVTNFGTLFRLRLLTAVPAWLAPLALTTGPVREWIRSETGQATPGAVTVPGDKGEGFEI